MVNFAICRKCQDCQGYEASRTDDKGRVTALPMVHCKRAGPLLGDSEPPENCAYAVEQLVTSEEAWDAHETFVDEMRDAKCGT